MEGATISNLFSPPPPPFSPPPPLPPPATEYPYNYGHRLFWEPREFPKTITWTKGDLQITFSQGCRGVRHPKMLWFIQPTHEKMNMTPRSIDEHRSTCGGFLYTEANPSPYMSSSEFNQLLTTYNRQRDREETLRARLQNAIVTANEHFLPEGAFTAEYFCASGGVQNITIRVSHTVGMPSPNPPPPSAALVIVPLVSVLTVAAIGFVCLNR